MENSVFEEWDELAADFEELEVANKIYLEKLNEVNLYLSTCKKHIEHQNSSINVINKTLKNMNKQPGHEEDVHELEEKIMERKLHLREIEQTLPKQNGIYLKTILGNVNVSIFNKEAKFKYKDEYEKFKLILNIIGLVMSAVNMSLHSRALELSFIFLLVWYYYTLTIRESILIENGSRTKGWWRLHHFLSTVAAGILLIWPDSPTWELFRTQFMWFNRYISLVQSLQFMYQRGVLYGLQALGEIENMDITIEGFHLWMWGGLSFLLPFLFFGYFFQLYNAYTLYMMSYNPTSTWHVPVLSIMFFILFIGNTATTIMVIVKKGEEKVKFRSRTLTGNVITKNTEDLKKQE